MPVRIYDIAKKLGIESKEVLARAKDLGITYARVPSSTLDKITAEYLEEQISATLVKPAPPPPPPAERPAPPAEPAAVEPLPTPPEA
ncbi:MAG TPA: translation initiation factor IF-2 N-terminal domain-containing protein, partial [Candidatus Paceibacterota bacterium]|nr:translation initiation factor IF-2 N-terminal domain-containing protein [Candidatus Paceibacterota bacterium]